jgi:TetR/AcrR family transcriptional repressor of bet genes
MGAAIQENPEKVRRKASKDVRRQQLIEATIEVISRKGYASLTIADVARTAGLSVGIISFHFEGKEKLLAASLKMLADEYYQNWKEALEQAGDRTADRLQAVLLSDFDDKIYTPQKLAAWIAFWGESQGRPIYEEICSPYDSERSRVVMELCRRLSADGGYSHDAKLVMFGLEGICEGMWLGTVSTAARIDPYITAETARKVVKTALHAYFPKHYNQVH